MIKPLKNYYVCFRNNEVDIKTISFLKKDSIKLLIETFGNHYTWEQLKKEYGFSCKKVTITFIENNEN